VERHFLGYFFFAVEKEVPCPHAQLPNKEFEAKRAKNHKAQKIKAQKHPLNCYTLPNQF